MFFAEYKLSLTLCWPHLDLDDETELSLQTRLQKTHALTLSLLLSQYAVSVPLRSTITEAQTAKQIVFDLFGNNSQ